MRGVLWPIICKKCVCGQGPNWGSSRRSLRPPSRLGGETPRQTPPHSVPSAPQPSRLRRSGMPPTHNIWLRNSRNSAVLKRLENMWSACRQSRQLYVPFYDWPGEPRRKTTDGRCKQSPLVKRAQISINNKVFVCH